MKCSNLLKFLESMEKASLQKVIDSERETVKKLQRSLEDTEHKAQAEVMRVRQEVREQPSLTLYPNT